MEIFRFIDFIKTESKPKSSQQKKKKKNKKKCVCVVVTAPRITRYKTNDINYDDDVPNKVVPLFSKPTHCMARQAI